MCRFIVLLMTLMSNVTFAAVVTVGSDASCDFASLQAAIDASPAEATEIRVTNQTVISDSIIVEDKNITVLQGGFDDCDAAENNQLSDPLVATEIANSNDTGLTVFYKSLISHEISIRGFNIHNHDQWGVDVLSRNANESLTVHLSELNLYNNRIGLYVDGAPVTVNFDHGQIYENENTLPGASGGGVRCFDGTVNLMANSSVRNNIATKGGGVAAVRCRFNLYAGDTQPLNDLMFGVVNNQAIEYGGGLLLTDAIFRAVGNNNHPASISGNQTTNPQKLGYGGGIYLSYSSEATLVNARVDGNVAQKQGGGILIRPVSSDTPKPKLNMFSEDCDYSEICSSLSNNRVVSNSGHAGGLALISGAQATIQQTLIQNNQAHFSSFAYLYGDGSSLRMESSLLTNHSGIANNPSRALIVAKDATAFLGAYLTVVANQSDKIINLLFSNNTGQNFELYNSIISNSDAQILDMNDGEDWHDANVDCSILHEAIAADVAGNDTVVGDPGFQGGGDYHLTAEALAANMACTGAFAPTTTDIRGIDRLAADGTADVGAYEYVVGDDVIFKNSFD